MCRSADWVLVGEAVSRHSFIKVTESTQPRTIGSDAGRFSRIVTDVTFRTVARARGRSPTEFVLQYPGGHVDGVTEYSSIGEWIDVGARYLLLVHEYTGPPGPGRLPLIVLKSIRLARGAKLPAEDEMSSIWAEHCDPANPPDSRPTARYAPFLDKGLIEWCEHY